MDKYGDLSQFLNNNDNVFYIFNLYQIANLVKDILVFVLKTGSIEIGVIEDVQSQLSEVDPNLKIENIS